MCSVASLPPPPPCGVAEPNPALAGGFSSLIQNIAIFNTGALNYVEFRAAMHPTWCMAEGVGFEPTSPFGEAVFKTAALNHSAIPP